MTATVKKIHPLRESRNGGSAYQRIEFVDDKGGFFITDLVPGFRNYRRWVPILEAGEGTRVKGLKEKWEGKVDADSKPKII